MRKTIVLTQHAKDRWQERIGRGSIFRSIRRARRAGPDLQRRINAGEGLTALVDRRKKALFLVEEQGQMRCVVTVLKFDHQCERARR